MKKETHPDDIGPFKMSPFGAIFSIAIGCGMLGLTYIMTKGMVKLIRENEQVSIKQIIISVIVFLVFFSASTLFIRRGVRRFTWMFEKVDK